MKKRVLGRHLLMDFHGCATEAIDDPDLVREALLEAARRVKATIVTDVFHRFNPHGLSGVVVIAESHIAIHTWPEHGVASVDVFSCGDRMTPKVIEAFLRDVFRAERVVCSEVERGGIPECPIR